MKLVGQGLSCFHKLFIFPNQYCVSFRTFSSMCSTGNKHKELFSSVSFINNHKTSKNISNMSSHPVRISGCQRVNCAPLAVCVQKMVSCSLEHHMSRLMTPLFTSATAYSTSTQGATYSEASKSHSALQVRRSVRKRLPTESDAQKIVQIDNVVAYAVAEDIDLPGLEHHLVKQGLYIVGQLPQDVVSVLHLRGKYTPDQKPKEIFVFEDGSVIFWCVPEVERSSFLKMLVKVSRAPYSSSLMLYEKEEIDFTFTGGKTCLAGDLIQLKEDDKDSQQRLLEMYAFSNALAQSVKLAMWEASFNKFVDSIENVTEDLRRGRKISMSRQQVLMKTGELFTLRHLINLSSDLLDTPDFYWDREALEPLYISLCNYLSISRRTKVMNQKLNHCCELTELLSSHLNDTHHTRLEVMIILLILIEVVFEIVHSAERYWQRRPTETLTQFEDAEMIKEPGNILVH